MFFILEVMNFKNVNLDNAQSIVNDVANFCLYIF